MPSYIHTFRCVRCGRHLDYRNQADDDGGQLPSVFHDDLAKYLSETRNGNAPRVVADEDRNCTGRLLYHSTEMVAPPPARAAAPVDDDWNAFETAVLAAWQAFKNSGYSAALRGPNHDRAYRMPDSVSARLRSAAGQITIGNKVYSIAPSKTTHVALHSQLTDKQGAGGTYQSFVFHL